MNDNFMYDSFARTHDNFMHDSQNGIVNEL